MHEYALVQSLLARVEEEARAHGAAAVRRVTVSLGELAGVEPDLLRNAYEIARGGTACAEAELVLAAVAAEWRCPSCRRAIGRGAPLSCPACGRPAELAPGGDAIVLERIEMEVA